MCPAWITSAEEPRTLLYELHKGRDVRGAVVEVELGTTKDQAGLEVAYSRNPLRIRAVSGGELHRQRRLHEQARRSVHLKRNNDDDDDGVGFAACRLLLILDTPNLFLSIPISNIIGLDLGLKSE